MSNSFLRKRIVTFVFLFPPLSSAPIKGIARKARGPSSLSSFDALLTLLILLRFSVSSLSSILTYSVQVSMPAASCWLVSCDSCIPSYKLCCLPCSSSESEKRSFSGGFFLLIFRNCYFLPFGRRKNFTTPWWPAQSFLENAVWDNCFFFVLLRATLKTRKQNIFVLFLVDL